MGISEELQPQVLERGYSFERILLPLDGSTSAERALPLVRALSEKHGSQVVLARVVEPPASQADPDLVEDSLQIARMYLRQVATALAYHGIDARTVVRVGPVPRSLLAAAAEEDISIITMSTHGRLTPEARPFGTVGQELLRSSSLPILAVPPHARSVKPSQSIHTMLLPVDGSTRPEDLGPVAVEFAVAFGVDLAVLVQVVEPEVTGRGEAEERVDAEEHLGRLARLFDRKRIPTVHLIPAGDPVGEILGAARDHRADVIAMSTRHGASAEGGGVGSVTEGVIKESTIPLLTTRPLAEPSWTPPVESRR
jgi:nucleotide-binding universal stress UspA family protein